MSAGGIVLAREIAAGIAQFLAERQASRPFDRRHWRLSSGALKGKLIRSRLMPGRKSPASKPIHRLSDWLTRPRMRSMNAMFASFYAVLISSLAKKIILRISVCSCEFQYRQGRLEDALAAVGWLIARP